MRTLTGLFLILAAGCGGGTTGGADMPVSGDLAGADLAGGGGGDLAGAPDLAGGGAADLAGCFGGPSGKCAACIKFNCGSEIAMCVGAQWETMTTPGSPCENLYACVCSCMAKPSDGGTDCFQTCVPQQSMSCQNCIGGGFGACLMISCKNDCN